ncbi:TetR/AcrR family transcriptional regulator [Acinetobacter baumannii]|uniref:TetR/AcrR family transcriptional regulator n=1 Tax=Acinetobacter baumannii TaxID=470 RepID=A0A204EVH3_ACIBA|nr:MULTISPECIES: TetR/AcrR family transcriptional regulator [Acinetobacter]AYX95036.1 TetR/AcrR family transcriptional regulator [Acinetobacter sp. FDAARGOS_493]EHU1230325.1 TetR/AcrR family transcriptional regulator [Acinetobacter baumannii]EHU1234335.1 TetR/AcrR family transcriptional regulator [Acinetobacter baumannii]EHU1246547.1 TetR/AcrR family transcriptional regulator [Acinetobacter baumannii]EHU1343893.1 TetR/AcrR family transcriptional regulator [Acinetobacter baumannii]
MRTKEFETDEIAEAAMQVFWRRGYAATSVQDLVDGTGLSRSSLYSTFQNKQGLYQKALQRYELLTTLNNVKLLSGSGSAKALIRQLLMRVVEDELNDSEHKGCLVANACLELAGHDEDVSQFVVNNLQKLQHALESLLIKAQQSGEIASTQNPRALASFFLNTMQGLRVLGKGSPHEQRKQCLMDVVEVALNVL